jgi:peptidoglycan biosynthesis protein MviN/MurJ (putative lipid II flippase)
MGHPEMQMKAWIWMAVSNAVLSICFVLLFGYVGVLVATTVSLGSAHAINLVLFHRHLRIPLVSFLARMWSWPVVACVAGAGATIVMRHYAGVRWEILSRLEKAEWLLILGAVFSCVYALVILRSRYLDKVDRRVICAWLPRAYYQKAVDAQGMSPDKPRQEWVQPR